MKKGFEILLFVLWPLLSEGQTIFNPQLSNFAPQTLTAAMGDVPVEFMNGEEQKVVFYMNLVRLEPQVFLKDVLRPYVCLLYTSDAADE